MIVKVQISVDGSSCLIYNRSQHFFGEVPASELPSLVTDAVKPGKKGYFEATMLPTQAGTTVSIKHQVAEQDW